MKRAPKIDNCNLSRLTHRLRTKRHAPVKPSIGQELMTSIKYRAYQPTAGKADLALSPTAAAQKVCQIRSKASTPPKSP